MNLDKEQKERLLNYNGSLEMVQFLNFPSNSDWDEYLKLSSEKINKVGGKRKFNLKIDMVLSGMKGQEIPYSFVTIDSFSNSLQLLEGFRVSKETKKELKSDVYTLVLTPDASMKVVSKLRFLRPLFNLFFKIDRTKKFKPDVHLNQPERNATSEKLKEFKTLNQNDPFYNINLNKYFPVPAGNKKTKEEYYKQFSKDTARATGPKVLGMGAYPAVSGKVVEIIENQGIVKSMADDWDNFLLVYYPKREDYIYLVPNLSEEIILKRKNAYERGIQFPCTKTKY